METIVTTLGSGIEAMLPKIRNIEGPIAFIMPNFKHIRRAKEVLGAENGVMGVDFFTFDDVAKELAIDVVRGEKLAVYAFRKLLSESECVFSNLETLENVQRLFHLLEAADKKCLVAEDLPYSWKGQWAYLTALYRQAKDAAKARTKADVLEEAIAAPIFLKRSYIVYGFVGFSQWEWDLLLKLDAENDLAVVLPFGDLEDEALSYLKESLPSAEVLETPKLTPEIVRATATHRERAFRFIEETIREEMVKNPAARISVIIFDDEERAALKRHLEEAGIAVAKTTTVIDEALDDLRCVWRLNDEIANICAYLKSPFCTVDNAKAVANSLSSLNMDSLRDFKDRGRMRLFLEEEEEKVLRVGIGQLWEMCFTPKKSYDDFRKLTEACLAQLTEEQQVLLTDALERAEAAYGLIDGEEFESILMDALEKERIDGVEIMSLTAGYGYDYDCLLVGSLDRRFPKTQREDVFVNDGNIQVLQARGLFPDFLKPSGDNLALAYTMYASKKTMLLTWTEGEAATFFSQLKELPLIDLDEQREAYVKCEGLKTKEGAFGEVAKGLWLNQFKAMGLSPSAVDVFHSCPFKFFVERLLELKVEDMSHAAAMARGNLYHYILEQYFKGNLNTEDIYMAVARLYDQYFFDLSAPYLHQWEKAYMCRMVNKTIAEEEARLSDDKRNKGFSPRRFEAPYNYPLKGYQIRGKIDRIDEDEAGNEILIDYKTKSVPSFREVTAFEKMQLAMYALHRRMVKKRPVSLEYVSVEEAKASVMLRNTERAGGYSYMKKERARDDESFSTFLDDAEARLENVLERMEAGNFAAKPLNETVCDYCEFEDICRKDKTCLSN